MQVEIHDSFLRPQTISEGRTAVVRLDGEELKSASAD